MKMAGLVFYFCFAGNVLIRWGLPGSRKDSEGLSFLSALMFLLVTSATSLLYGVLYRIILFPINLEAFVPIAFLFCIFLIYTAADAMLKAKKGRSMVLKNKSFHFAMAIYAVAMFSGSKPMQAGWMFFYGLAAGFGYLAAGWMLENIMQRLDLENIPEKFRGAPIRLLSAGLMALAFYGIEISFFAIL